MYLPIDQMPDNSRIWIYQSSRMLSNDEEQFINENLRAFCAQWAAHGSDLQTSFGISHHFFVMLAVNEKAGGASGCSIDSSTHAIKSLGEQLKIDFFSRTQIAFADKESIRTYPLGELKKLFTDGKLNEHSVTFNILVSTLGEWRTQSLIKAGESWLSRFIPKIPVS